MLTMTDTAAEQILGAAQSQFDMKPGNEEEMPMLRVAAKIDEDGEIAYGMGFDEERENDHKIECNGLTVLISPHSQKLLAGTTLDFVEINPGEFQFVFFNPNEPPPMTSGCASRSNGCGSCGSGGSGSSNGGCS